MNQALIVLGIVMTVLTPTIAVVVSHILDRADRGQMADTAERNHADTQGRIQEIHVLANDRLDQALARLDEALARIRGLEQALGLEAGDPIPHS